MEKNNSIVKKILALPLWCLLAYLLMVLGSLLGIVTAIITKSVPSLANNDAWVTAEMYLEFWGIWAVFFLCLLIPINKPLINALNTKAKGNTLKGLLIGFLIGFGMNALCALAAMIHGDIHIYFDSFNLIPLIFIFICVFIQSSAEELICRCFLYQHLRRLYKNPWIAIICNFIFFGMGHLANDGMSIVSFVSIMLTGLLFSLLIYYFDSLWCAFGIHTAWNFTQNILFGLPNSGMVTPYSVFKLDGANARTSFFYDVAFGIEGSGMSCVILALACFIVIYLGKKKGPSAYDIWKVK